jgi:hypothetical protein
MVVGTARSMLKDKALPGVFWGEAVTTAVYLLNRTSCKANQGATPYELWTGSTPAVHHLRTFGCIAHVKVTAPNQKKLDDRSRRMIFVGYEAGTKAYRVYEPTTGRVHINRDVVFDEGAQWVWPADCMEHANDFTIDEPVAEEPAVITTISSRAAGTPPDSSSSRPQHTVANRLAGTDGSIPISVRAGTYSRINRGAPAPQCRARLTARVWPQREAGRRP